MSRSTALTGGKGYAMALVVGVIVAGGATFWSGEWPKLARSKNGSPMPNGLMGECASSAL